jgi:hypothetical protein
VGARCEVCRNLRKRGHYFRGDRSRYVVGVDDDGCCRLCGYAIYKVDYIIPGRNENTIQGEMSVL